MNVVDLIAKKRDCKVHSYEELSFLAQGAATGSIPDYQLSAWLMAAFLNLFLMSRMPLSAMRLTMPPL